MSDPPIYIELFGSLCAHPADQPPIEYAPQPTGTLLAYLALYRERPAAREEIIALIWPEVDEETGRHRLRQSLYALRRQLKLPAHQELPLLLTTRTTLQLNPVVALTDVALFEDAVRLASLPADRLIREQRLTEAIRLYRGNLLPGFFQDSFLVERNRLEGIYRNALRELTLLYEQMGECRRGVETAHLALALDPLMEETHTDLMRLYAAMGQSANALRQYQAMERILERELGAQPSESIRALMESIRQNGSSQTPHTFPAPNGLSKPELALAECEPVEDTRPVLPPKRAAAPSGRLALALSLLTVIALFVWKGNRLSSSSSPHLTTNRKGEAAANPIPTQPPIRQPLWVQRYEKRPEDRDSEPTVVTTDSAGAIYITGFIQTGKTNVDFLTLKYDSQGNLLWESRYDGPGKDVDRARSLVVDPSGNVYVAGDSDNGKGNDTTRLAGLDMAIIKYGPDGKPSSTWPNVGFGVGVRRYNGEDDGEDRPVQMLLAPHGGVYVLGSSWSHKRSPKSGGSDYVLIKYGESGEREWVARYNEEPHQEDIPVAMVCDPQGNIYVTGSSRVVTNVGQEQNFLTIKYAADGRRLWVRPYGANNQADDCARAIGLDHGGNVYVIGEGLGAAGTPDAARLGCLTFKYSPDGDLLWMRGTVQESDRITRVTAAGVSFAGNTFVTGQAKNELGQFVFRTVARNESGLFEWASSHQSVNTGRVMPEDAPAALILYHTVILTGSIYCGDPTLPGSKNTERDIITLCYDSFGKLIWIGQVDANRAEDYGRAMTLDPQFNVIVTGQSNNGLSRDIIIIKYSR